MDTQDFRQRDNRHRGPLAAVLGLSGTLVLGVFVVVGAFVGYTMCRIEVPTGHIAVLIKKTGKNLPNNEEIAPDSSFKGVQQKVLREGRYFYNPWHWDWEVIPQVEIPEGKLGVRVRLYGEELPYGEIIAINENQKGILADVLRPGRHPINALVQNEKGEQVIQRRYDSHAEIIELHDPVVISAGFRGVVTNLSGAMPTDPNQLLSEKTKRGVQEATLTEGTYYINPYVTRINQVDCRSQRFNLMSGGEMGFPSKDGFWVTLDGIIEFRVKPDNAPKVFVTYNEVANDGRLHDARIDEEIIKKVILPNARSFCRLRGSEHSGKEFIGETRAKFQAEFQDSMKRTCDSQGIEIIQALITQINPPQKIAEPVRKRQIAIQQHEQYGKELLQQEAEKQLEIEKETIKQKQAVVGAEQQVIKVTTAAMQKQEVAVIEANQRLTVADFELKAAQDLASAEMARGKAAAEVIAFENTAEAAGWQKSVEAFGNSGDQFARWTMLKKLAPAFRQMMVNTADSPLMEFFREYTANKSSTGLASTPVAKPPAAAAAAARE